MKKVGLVLEGGGLRGIFTSGVLDFFLDKGIKVDYVIGVSAGCANAYSYIAGKKGFFKDCVLNEKGFNSFFGIAQMAESKKLMNLDKVFEDFAEKYKFDYSKLIHSDIEWEAVVSNIETGLPEYKTEKKSIKKAQTIGKASCSLPILTFPVEIDKKLYLDGGICDSIPIRRAEEKGCDKIIVVATRRKGRYCHVSEAEKPIYNSLYGSKYPCFLEAIYKREEMYKEEISYIESNAKKGKIFLIRPTLPEAGRLETNTSKISLAYYHGYAKAEDQYEELKKYLKGK